jgi:hypothetical protein
VTLFLDTSVLLAAAGSAHGASRFILVRAEVYGWHLVSSGYCLQEAKRNLGKLPHPESGEVWSTIVEPCLHLVPDAVTLSQPLVFPKAKDRPVVVSGLAARAGVLLTLDRVDFHNTLGTQIYGMAIRTPAEFLIEQRRAGRI